MLYIFKLLLVVGNVLRLLQVFLRWLLSVIMNNGIVQGRFQLSSRGLPVVQESSHGSVQMSLRGLPVAQESNSQEGRGLYSLSENGNPVMQPQEDRINDEGIGLYSLYENGNPVMQPQEDRINDEQFESIADEILQVVVPEEL